MLVIAQLEEVRKRYGIRGGVDDDILKAVFCMPCALVQAQKEVIVREQDRKKQQYERREEEMVMVPGGQPREQDACVSAVDPVQG
jgi:hypothetical protein